MTFDYTDCDLQPAATSPDDLHFSDLADFSYSLKAGKTGAQHSNPQFAFLNRSTDTSVGISQRQQCYLQFDVPIDLDPTVLFYYKLTNFYQNHRRYVKSLNSDQLKGKFVSVSTLNGGDCKPLASTDNKAIYPCGLIANSVFNGTSIDGHPFADFYDPDSLYKTRSPL